MTNNQPNDLQTQSSLSMQTPSQFNTIGNASTSINATPSINATTNVPSTPYTGATLNHFGLKFQFETDQNVVRIVFFSQKN